MTSAVEVEERREKEAAALAEGWASVRDRSRRRPGIPQVQVVVSLSAGMPASPACRIPLGS